MSDDGLRRLRELETRELLSRGEIREWAELKVRTLDRQTLRLLVMLGDEV